MAIPRVKSTYSLDVHTVRVLERIARRWRVSKSEALRRAIHAVSAEVPGKGGEALAALEELQRSLDLTPARARAWAEAVRTERRASAAGRSRRSR